MARLRHITVKLFATTGASSIHLELTYPWLRCRAQRALPGRRPAADSPQLGYTPAVCGNKHMVSRLHTSSLRVQTRDQLVTHQQFAGTNTWSAGYTPAVCGNKHVVSWLHISSLREQTGTQLVTHQQSAGTNTWSAAYTPAVCGNKQALNWNTLPP